MTKVFCRLVVSRRACFMRSMSLEKLSKASHVSSIGNFYLNSAFLKPLQRCLCLDCENNFFFFINSEGGGGCDEAICALKIGKL